MLETVWIVLSTAVVTGVLAAVLSSVLTAWLLRRGFEKQIKPELERELETRLHAAVEGLGDVIRERVRQGVIDAVKSLPAPNLVREAQRSVRRTAADLVEGGLGSLLGVDRRKRDEE
jgi:hypothetical protein